MGYNANNRQLKGFSFKGQDLSEKSFADADIRGADFSGALLHGVDFSGAKAGLLPFWEVSLKIGLVVFVITLSFVGGYSGDLAGSVLPRIESLAGEIFFCVVGLSLIFSLPLVIIFRGLGVALLSLLVAAPIALTLGAASGFHESMSGLLVLFIGLTIGIAVMVTGAIATAITQIIPGKKIWFLMIVMVLMTATFAIHHSISEIDTEIFDQPWHIWLRVVSAVLLNVIWLSLSVYVGRQAIAGNTRYLFVYWVEIAISNYGSTSFREADLTDADFTNANLRQADFRDADLTRTCWYQAKFLAQARTDNEYLEDTKIRQLVVSLDGKNQNFDHFDLRGLNLAGADLTKASFIGAKLSGATLKGATLDNAKLVQTQLYGVNLRGASLTGAYIQNWSIATDTQFDGVKCNYVYMRLPTEDNPIAHRKPDNETEIFKPGDFADFITPIIKTLGLYQRQYFDPRVVAQQFKTLDLVHHGRVNPALVTIALKKLAENHPEADIEIAVLEGHGDDKVRMQATVNDTADPSALSAAYAAIYQEMASQSHDDSQALLDSIKDENIRNFASAMQTVTQSSNCFITVNQSFSGDIVHEKSEININSGGGNVSGVVGGNVENVSGKVNLGTVHGDANNAIGQQQ